MPPPRLRPRPASPAAVHRPEPARRARRSISNGRRRPAVSAAPDAASWSAVKDKRIVATHGDMQAEVNRGLNCVKGYFLSKIMYGARPAHHAADAHAQRRVTTRMPSSAGELGPGLRRDGAAVETRAEGKGAGRRGHVRLGPVDDLEGYAATKLMRAGFRSNNSIPTRGIAWRRPRSPSSAASAWTSRWAATTTSSMPTPSCCGARTWPRCIRSSGRASSTAG